MQCICQKCGGIYFCGPPIDLSLRRCGCPEHRDRPAFGHFQGKPVPEPKVTEVPCPICRGKPGGCHDCLWTGTIHVLSFENQ